MRNPRIQLMVQLFTLIIIMLSLIKHELFVSSSLVVALVLIVLIGIPHGANDHLLFFNLINKRVDEKNEKSTLFFSSYIGLILLYVCCWYLFPTFSLGLFILISIYHFGQSNVYISPIESKFVKLISIFLSGSFVLLTPIFAHIETALPVIQTLTKNPDFLVISEKLGNKLAISTGMLMIIHWVILMLSKHINLKDGLIEILNVFLLFGLFYYSPLWIGFAIYFTLWHAIPSIEDQINFFKTTRENYNLGKYIREIFPFSLIALLGLFLAFQFSGDYISVNQGLALLFSFIAVITLPHMIMMDLLYLRLGGKNFSQ
ncbi:MAG: Brp/Blh family beta-carotene 15,15'-dioxygenase [Saprospiraceae bacterium]